MGCTICTPIHMYVHITPIRSPEGAPTSSTAHPQDGRGTSSYTLSPQGLSSLYAHYASPYEHSPQGCAYVKHALCEKSIKKIPPMRAWYARIMHAGGTYAGNPSKKYPLWGYFSRMELVELWKNTPYGAIYFQIYHLPSENKAHLGFIFTSRGIFLTN